MCGILGFVGEIKKKEAVEFQKLITNLFAETETRGQHASGYAALVDGDNGKTRVSYSKLPVRASQFVDHDIYYRSMWDWNPTIFLGHTRYATSGSPKNNKNNHPFSIHKGNTWMIHNGMSTALGSKEIRKKCISDCDSEYIIRVIERDGWIKGAKKICNSEADFALLFLDRREKKMRFLRNEGRPMYMIDARKKYGVFIFCSTEELFTLACKDSGVNISQFEITSVESNVLYSIDIKLAKLTSLKIKVNKPETTINFMDDDIMDGLIKKNTKNRTTKGKMIEKARQRRNKAREFWPEYLQGYRIGSDGLVEAEGDSESF